MDWARHLQVSENGSYRLTLYRQDGQNFACLSDAPDALPADADIVACVRLSGMNAFVCDRHPPLNRAVCLRDAFPLKRCLDALAREAPRARAYADEALSLTVGLALIEFLRCVEDEALPQPSKAQRAAAAVQHMLNEYRHPWRVEELSAQAGVSSSYLTKFCRREYGKSPMALLLGRRLDVAVTQLQKPDATVGSACEAAGFSDVYYFSRLFRQKLGRPPRDFLSKPER